jgi:copper chaperone
MEDFDMTTETIRVEGMSCDHCVKAVTAAASALPGVASVSVDLKGGTATVDYDPALSTLDQLKTAIEDQGFDIGA